jgi:ADP-ribose pyrophosphatase YjhB (NUDIX family)
LYSYTFNSQTDVLKGVIMNFCSDCGHKVTLLIPEGDSKPRHTCESCDTVHYSNPNIVAGAIVEQDGKILLCKRAIEPRLGYWTLPAGFMENDESVEEAAIRETWEEAHAKIKLTEYFSQMSIPQANQVHVFYRAQFEEISFSSGPESLEVELFAIEDIPWKELSFHTVKRTLELYVLDHAEDAFGFYSEVIRRDEDKSINVESHFPMRHPSKLK